jgi:hypothetical protein
MAGRSTYTLATAVAASILLFAPATGLSQWLKHPTPGIPRTSDGRPNLSAPAPRASDGKPDLTGLWLADERVDTDLKVSDALAWARAEVRKHEENPPNDSWATLCLPAGPNVTFTGPFKIMQTPTLTGILYETTNNYRQIFTDGRGLPTDPNPTWQGYSVGHWDGDALVVETTGFNDRSRLGRPALYPHSEALRLIERYRRRDFGHIDLEMTFDDPKAFARPWTMKTVLTLQPDTEMLEYVCNENEKDRQHFVETPRSSTVVVADPAVLAKFVGMYDIPGPRGAVITATVTLENNQLVLDAPGRGRAVLTQQSPTMFIFRGIAMEFIVDEHGEATHLVAHAVEGDFKGARTRPAPSSGR